MYEVFVFLRYIYKKWYTWEFIWIFWNSTPSELNKVWNFDESLIKDERKSCWQNSEKEKKLNLELEKDKLKE